jgi:hypothetical protein
MRNAVHEIRCAVQRVNDEAMCLVGTFDLAFFFHQKAIAGARLGQFFEKNFLGFQIGLTNKIARTFFRYLEIFDLAEIATQGAPGLFDRGTHHIHGWRLRHLVGSFQIGDFIRVDDNFIADLDKRRHHNAHAIVTHGRFIG